MLELSRHADLKLAFGWALGLCMIGPQIASASEPLAALSEPGGYVSWVRIVLILVMMLPWLAFCQWVDQDTVFVRRMNRQMWNGIVLGGGAAGLLVWLFMPWKTAGLFAAGFGLWFVITACTCTIYVVIRNGLVDRSVRVFTPNHIKVWISRFGKPKEQRLAVSEQVRLMNADGAKVDVPDDPTQAEPYQATQTLLYDALWRRATEVELLVAAKGVRLAYRIDGVVTPRNDLLDRENAERAMTFIKQAGGLDIKEHRRPQAGSISATISGSPRGATDIEVRTSGTTQHERLSMRIVGQETRLRISDLGMDQPVQEKFEKLLEEPGGLFLVSGPRASGVTTTLYAALRCHDAFMSNLLTLEREPLMELENITQNIYDANLHDGSYARQLQTVLRREPDVVMVSECLDRETAHHAVRAAQAGKRIYLGIQANDSFDALKQLISLAGDTDTVAEVLRVVTAQRLIRKLCIACRIAYKPDPQLLKKANLPASKIEHFYRNPRPDEMMDEKGNPHICANCQGSGYFGRTGLFELLDVDRPMRELIHNGQPLSAIRAHARKNGMLYLQEVGLKKVMQGITGMNEMLRVLRNEEGGPPRAAVKKGG